MSVGSGDALIFSGNERGAAFDGRISRPGKISGAVIQWVWSKLMQYLSGQMHMSLVLVTLKKMIS